MVHSGGQRWWMPLRSRFFPMEQFMAVGAAQRLQPLRLGGRTPPAERKPVWPTGKIRPVPARRRLPVCAGLLRHGFVWAS
ncbi:MAG: hypothetical protein EST26_00860 [Hydrogenophaga sp.]|nr:hypothetical protein [Hydrogenophaga sp.]